MAGKLRRLRQPGSRLPHDGLPPENIHPPAKPLLRGGPFTTEDWPYVFGDKPPVNTQNKGAGIDISPAVRDYLGITGGTAIVHWRFVEFYRIPRGPWSKYGDNNPFVNAGLGAGKKSLQSREDRLRRQQEAIQRELLKDPAKLRRELQG